MSGIGPREIPRSVPLVAVTRGGRVESVHRGSVAVVSEDGRLLACAGDPRQPVWLRSSAKPFQLLPFLAAGGAERFALTTEEIALAAASHSGEPAHVRLAAGLLAKGGFRERRPPLRRASPDARGLGPRSRVLREGPDASPQQLLGQARRDAPRVPAPRPRSGGLLEEGHPLQRRILSSVSRMTGVPAGRIERAVDGCSVPVFRVPLAALALAYARLVGSGPPRETPAEGAARRRIAGAMAAAPEMVAGTGRFTTDLVREFRAPSSRRRAPRACTPSGSRRRSRTAAGRRLGIGVKIADGAERGRDAVTVEVLRALGLAKGARLARLRALAFRPVLNVRGDVVGGLETVFRLGRP